MNHSYMPINTDLDTIRIRWGDTYLKATFNKMLKTNKPYAISLLNHQNLSFPTLYILIPQIIEYNLVEYLVPRNKFALNFSAQNSFDVDASFEKKCLRWMLLSSANQELDTDDFQEIIDRVVIQLLLVLKEYSLLPVTVNLIFTRNREDQCIYDLCWAVYQSHRVQTMPLVAKFIKSNDEKDNELAYKLLNFKPELQPKNRIQQYDNFCKWFSENGQFLYYSNENMQETCQPKYWRVNLPAKYLCKSYKNKNLLSDEEKRQLDIFQHLDRKTQKLLSKYSYEFYSKNKKEWQGWIKSSIDMQLEACRIELGGKK